MSKKIKTEAAKRLFQAVLTLETEEECFTFFEDLCTVNELESLAQRFEVASMLYDKHTYLEVADKTGASTATISRVNRSLNYGSDGYDMVFKRIRQMPISSFSFLLYCLTLVDRVHRSFSQSPVSLDRYHIQEV